jgi:hypothetical protein
MIVVELGIKTFRKLTILSTLVGLSACSSISPLDSIIGDTGRPF